MTPPLPRFVVFGEALTDFIREDDGRWRSVPGGSCWNVARVGARLGVPTGYAGTVSQDPFGDALVALSADSGLDMRFTRQVERSPLIAMVVSKHPPRYFFVGDDSADLAFDPQLLPQGWLAAARTVHFGSLSLVREPLASRLIDVAVAAHSAGKRISFDPNFREPMRHHAYRATLTRMAGLAHYIKISDEDLLGLFPDLDERSALAQLRAWAPHADILVTRGALGMELLTPRGDFFQPAFATEVADTVGCGDACMGGWMSSLLTTPEAPPAAHLAFAAACASVVCSREGAYAPTFEEAARVAGARDEQFVLQATLP